MEKDRKIRDGRERGRETERRKRTRARARAKEREIDRRYIKTRKRGYHGAPFSPVLYGE
jgi:hypothetical protein